MVAFHYLDLSWFDAYDLWTLQCLETLFFLTAERLATGSRIFWDDFFVLCTLKCGNASSSPFPPPHIKLPSMPFSSREDGGT